MMPARPQSGLNPSEAAAASLMIPLSHLSVQTVSGPDAGPFLQAQLAGDLAGMADGEARFSAYCSPRGQVYALLLAQRRADAFHLVGQHQLVPSVIERLTKFVLRARVEFGPEEQTFVAGIDLAQAESQGARHDTAGEMPLRPAGVPQVYLLRESSAESPAADLECWRRDEILNGICWLSPPVSERFIPQMLGLDRIGAVSFSKGCYPGQEIVARTRYLGTLKRRPVMLQSTAAVRMAAGAACSLETPGGLIEGVVIESIGTPRGASTLLVVAAVEDHVAIRSIISGAGEWPVERAAQRWATT